MGKAIVFFLLGACVVSFSGCSGVREKTGIAGFLLSIKRDQRAKDAQMDRETRAFQKAKEALLENKGRIKPMGQDAARAFFGEPVVIFKNDNSTVWAYKPSSSDWLKGEKIFLTFDEKGNFSSAEYQPS